MGTHQIRDAAYAVVNGGIGFVPMPPRCQLASQKALRTLVKLGKYRKEMKTFWKDEQWGYELDDRQQFNKGFSQWRDDERKDVFHYEPETPDILQEKGALLGKWDDFLDPCAHMYKSLFSLGLECAHEFDRILPGYDFAESATAAEHMDLLRLLAYERRHTDESITAYSHRDRDFISIHVFETAPGFYVGHDEKTQIRVAIPPGHAAIFAGRKFEQMTDGKVKALWHGTCEVPELEPKGRRSVVFFKHTDVPLIRESGELEKAAA